MNSETTTTLSQLLETWVRDSGLRVEFLAERVGVSRQTVYKWTSGATAPTLENLDRLADELGKGARDKRAAIDALIAAKKTSN